MKIIEFKALQNFSICLVYFENTLIFNVISFNTWLFLNSLTFAQYV